MAHHKSALKRIRQDKKRAARNRHFKSMLKTMTKKVLTAEDQSSAAEPLKEVTSLLDKMARKNIIHRNKASNQKSRLTKFYSMLSSEAG